MSSRSLPQICLSRILIEFLVLAPPHFTTFHIQRRLCLPTWCYSRFEQVLNCSRDSNLRCLNCARPNAKDFRAMSYPTISIFYATTSDISLYDDTPEQCCFSSMTFLSRISGVYVSIQVSKCFGPFHSMVGSYAFVFTLHFQLYRKNHGLSPRLCNLPRDVEWAPIVSAVLDLNICDAKQISHNNKVEISSVGCLTFSIGQGIFRYWVSAVLKSASHFDDDTKRLYFS
jgi:hypothetical protein